MTQKRADEIVRKVIYARLNVMPKMKDSEDAFHVGRMIGQMQRQLEIELSLEVENTLHSPLTKEDWNKLLDAEHENTRSVTFQTPQGKQVRYIKCEVLDKIRAEIRSMVGDIETIADALAIIDKYKVESEE